MRSPSRDVSYLIFSLLVLERATESQCLYIYFFFIFKIICGCCGSSSLPAGFPPLWCVGASLWLQSAGFAVRWLLLLRSTGLVALQHVRSSKIGEQTHVSCTGRRVLTHCATREVPFVFLRKVNWSSLEVFY